MLDFEKDKDILDKDQLHKYASTIQYYNAMVQMWKTFVDRKFELNQSSLEKMLMLKIDCQTISVLHKDTMTVSLDKEKKVYTLIYGAQSNALISFDELNKSWNLHNFFTSLFSEYWAKVSLDDVHYKIKQIFEDYGISTHIQ